MAYKPKILSNTDGGTAKNNAGTLNKMLIGDGTQFTESTPTFPNASASSGKIIQSDGTNWLASTPTYPLTAGTSGNVLTSDGTNWVSGSPPDGALHYPLYFNSTSTTINLGDSTTYYLPLASRLTINGQKGYTKMWIPVSGTITAVYGDFTVGGTLATTQNSTLVIRLNNTTSTNITTTQKFSATSNPFSNTGLSIAVSAGDYIEIRFATPAFTTNPTLVQGCATVVIT